MMARLHSPIAFLAALTLLTSPIRVPAAPEPLVLDAAAWIAVDVGSGTTLLEHNADEERAMASVTKLMTALVVRAHANLDDRVRISEAAVTVGEAEVGLVAGEVWSVRDLLAAVLVRSGNDAAYALAEHVGGSVAGFADMMNEMASGMGLEHSHFVNPHGLDEDDHYTSARDLTVIAEAVLADEVLAQFTRTGIVRFKASPEGVSRIATNTNHLLNHYPGVIGLKTGYTGRAGRVLVSAAEIEGQTVVAVVMGSENHFRDTAAILDHVSQAYTVGDRMLVPLAEQEGGGGPVGLLGLEEQRYVKSRQPLPSGRDAVTPWGETPGSQRIEDMVREMIPVVLGGSA
jgi:D-alanyl-D-alanine carboxypeptidase (penicillin-binding protein 5/6)